MHQFDEHHVEFEGFSDFYAREILPALERDETARLEAIKKAQLSWPAIGAVAAVGLAIAWYFGATLPIYAFITIGAGGGMVAASKYFLEGVRSATKDNIMGGICRFLGWSFSEKVEQSTHLDTYLGLELLPKSYDRVSYEDRVTGAAHGAQFELYEAHLEKRHRTKNGERWETKFRGQLLVLDFDRKFLGRTVVLRDKGMFNRKAKGEMKRVGLVDPVFEKIFEAYGTDQVEARYLLTPTFMQRLVDLENSVDGKNIRFGFDGGQLLIAVETKNRYEVGSMFKPLIDTARTQKILDEIGAIYDVIDGVMKPAGRT